MPFFVISKTNARFVPSSLDFIFCLIIDNHCLLLLKFCLTPKARMLNLTAVRVNCLREFTPK